MKQKYIVLVVAALFGCTTITSQNEAEKQHEFSLWGTAGMSSLKHSSDISDSKNGVGGSFGIGYNYRLNPNWSVGSGLEMSFYNAKSTIDQLTDRYDANDGEYDFVLHTTINDYKEKQKVSYLNIPIVAQFQLPVLGENSFYASGGFKIGIPVSKKITVDKAYFDNSGYYPEWDNPIASDPYFMGFGKFRSKDKKGNLDLNVNYMLSLESGMKWKLVNDLALYTGVYFDYGLNDLKKSDSKRLIQYNTDNPEDYIHNSALLSKYTDAEGNTSEITKKVNSIAVGLKVKLAFSM